MISRIYVEKKAGYDIEAQQLMHELQTIIGITNIEQVRILNRYDVSGIAPQLFDNCISTVFSEPQTDRTFRSLGELLAASDKKIKETKAGIGIDETGTDIHIENVTDSDLSKIDPALLSNLFAVTYLPGQFDQRADSASECIQLISQGDRPIVKSAKIYQILGDLSKKEIEKIKDYVVNPVEAMVDSLELPKTLEMQYPDPKPVEILEGFLDLDQNGLTQMIAKLGLAMDLGDITFCQQYFADEKRDPTITEIKMIDTYWSDHCRHTTFGTILEDIEIEDSIVQTAFNKYLEIREELGRTQKPLCLMDMGTIGAKYLRAHGLLERLDESEEVNACTVKVVVDVDGEPQDWLFLFKNETHNHPTEIEPFGGAATCVGGAIRDPLSGRSYVYQAMRVTGAGDPLVDLSETLEGKLPQRKLVTTAAAGYSSYGNQIGLATGQVDELYHPGYVAKRMEIGAVLGATPADHVRRETPAPGDVIVLLGGRTGRDGIGGATGSSKAHDLESIETCGAEVQKGNPPIERKIQRLFRRKEACTLIKRCNDFGAGGVSVAIGELADGLDIDLDKVPKKYEGLDGTELALSESQERMAVALDSHDVDEFIAYAHEENLEATPIAVVTEEPFVTMRWQGNTIVNIKRDFLASNGAPKHAKVHISKGHRYTTPWGGSTLKEKFENLLSDLNCCSGKGLSERFDSTIGAASVLMPFGGIYQQTPSMAMIAKLPVDGETTTTSGLAWGFNPYIMERDQYRGAYLSVVESVSKMVAAGFERKDMYLTFQEYFEKLHDDPYRWGKPTGALLGALMAQIDLKIGSIGGKDSMSGSFEDLDVPPTLVSFAAGTGHLDRATSPEFKDINKRIACIHPYYESAGLLPEAQGLNEVFEYVENLIGNNLAISVSTPGYGCCAQALFEMCVGNRIGIEFSDDFDTSRLFIPAYGTFLVELNDIDLPSATENMSIEIIGKTIENYEIKANEEILDLVELQKVWEFVLEPVFPSHGSGEEVKSLSSEKQIPLVNTNVVAKPRVVIPVFPGTNCEYDTARAFRNAGALPTTFVINNLSPKAVTESTHELAKLIEESQIVMIPGGFSGGDEPDGSAKFITAFFRAPEITEAVRDLLQKRDGLMLGICNGFQALIKLGLVPFGDIIEMDDTCPTLTFNTIGRHQSRIVRTRVCSTISPWLSKCDVGDIHTMPISHGEGRFIANDEQINKLIDAAQIATQYVGIDGRPSMDLEVNPNGSVLCVEGITSPDGRIFGKMGHTERAGRGLYKNIPDISWQPLFEGGVGYFSD